MANGNFFLSKSCQGHLSKKLKKDSFLKISKMKKIIQQVVVCTCTAKILTKGNFDSKQALINLLPTFP